MSRLTERASSAVAPERTGAAGAPGRYAFRAMRADGRVEEGEVAAASRDSARDQLASQGLFPIDVYARLTLGGGGSRLSAADLSMGLRLLASLLGAGLAMERALAVFPHIAPRGWARDRIEALRAAVREGHTIAGALRTAGLRMPPHVSGMLDAGEAAGTLANVLRQVADLMERAAEHRAAVRGALAYPAILAFAGTVAVALLVGVVLPRFAELLADVGQRLPTSAALLLVVADVTRRWGFIVLVAAVAVVIGAIRLVGSDRETRRRFHQWLLAPPLVGGIRHATAGARLTAALAAMLGAGVPLATALTHSAHAAGDEAITGRVLAARDQVIRGERLSRAFAEARAVRESVVQLIRAGEATGEMTEMLQTAARIEEEWSVSRIRALTRLIEPALILVFGGLIAFIAAALLQAVYAIRPTP